MATLVLSSSDLASSYTQGNVTCFGGSNGSIDLTVTGGDAPYTYEWTATNGGVIPSGQEDDQDLSGLVVGTYEVTVTDDNDCTTSETITITSPLELTVTCPADVSLPECTTEAAILSAYNTWIGGFSTSGGSNPGAPSMAPSLPTFECGSAVSLTYNYSVTDDCGTETCSSDFLVAAAEAVDVDGPATDETLACAYADDAALQGAYSAWLLEFETLENGCGNDGDFTTTPPAADMSICTSGSITLTYSADDGCTSDSHTSTFGWTQGLQVDVAGPANDETDACAYADDATLQGAYTAWLGQFQTLENGCGNDWGLSPRHHQQQI